MRRGKCLTIGREAGRCLRPRQSRRRRLPSCTAAAMQAVLLLSLCLEKHPVPYARSCFPHIRMFLHVYVLRSSYFFRIALRLYLFSYVLYELLMFTSSFDVCFLFFLRLVICAFSVPVNASLCDYFVVSLLLSLLLCVFVSLFLAHCLCSISVLLLSLYFDMVSFVHSLVTSLFLLFVFFMSLVLYFILSFLLLYFFLFRCFVVSFLPAFSSS